MNASTAGSLAMIAATARWWSTIDWKEMSCDASVMTERRPSSCIGTKPRGSRTTTTAVSATDSARAPTVSRG